MTEYKIGLSEQERRDLEFVLVFALANFDFSGDNHPMEKVMDKLVAVIKKKKPSH